MVRHHYSVIGVAAWLLGTSACNAVLGLDDLRVEATAAGAGGRHSGGTTGNSGGSGPRSEGGTETGGTTSTGGTTGVGDAAPGDAGPDGASYECATHSDCAPSTLPGSDGAVSPAICVRPERRCVPLLSEDCTTVTGDYTDDRAIFIGSLFSTKGAQAATNIPRQQSATLAVEEIDAAGGVPVGTSAADSRPLVMVSCDESTDLLRAGRHLVDDLHVPAIVGPNTSQDTLDLSTNLTVHGKTVLMTPTAVASSISDLLDEDLTWLMVPNDVQRAPLMLEQIGEIEASLRVARQRELVRLGVVFRNDALGVGTRSSLNALVLNGKAITDPINLGKNVRIDPYDFKSPDQDAIVDAYVQFAPDIVVLAGTAEAIVKVMVPLEARWTAGDRPYYVLIDSVKVPELIAAAKDDDLRRRIRGTGITPGAASAPVYDAFKVDYQLRYPGSPATISGMGPSYDAAYAIAYAIAASRESAITGPSIARGLRKLAGGATTIPIQSTKILAAFQKLVEGEKIAAVGTFGALQWDANGAVVGGTLEMWCIGSPAGTPLYQSSGLLFDVASGRTSGSYTQCGP